MKFSRFNYYIEKKDRVYILNTKSGLICEITYELYNKIKNNNKLNNEEKEIFNDLKENLFIVNEQKNEILELEQEFINNRKDNNHTSITFAPTLKCNFDCVYCYERKNNTKISNQNLNILLNYLDRFVLKNTKKITFSWFGGEPSLCKDIIINFSNDFLLLCKKYNIKTKIMIITNGYLLDNELIDFYKSISDLELCITIDGYRDEHNKRRYLNDKKETFDKIISNLKILIANNINTTIRVNIDKENSKDVPNLIDFLEKSNIKPNKIYLGHIQNFTKECSNNTYLTKREFAQEQSNINKLLYDKKLSATHLIYEGPKKTYCKANYENSIIIDHDLNLYKCENDIGRKELSFNNILNHESEKNKRFEKWTPFDYEKCINCVLLPSCMGGCAYTSMKYGEPQCPSFKYKFEEEAQEMIKQLENN